MSTLTIRDLPLDVQLDRKAMVSIYGGGGVAGGAPWVFAFQPVVQTASRAPGSIINVFESNTYYMADRMTNQVLNINGSNSASITMVGITG